MSARLTCVNNHLNAVIWLDCIFSNFAAVKKAVQRTLLISSGCYLSLRSSIGLGHAYVQGTIRHTIVHVSSREPHMIGWQGNCYHMGLKRLRLWIRTKSKLWTLVVVILGRRTVGSKTCQLFISAISFSFQKQSPHFIQLTVHCFTSGIFFFAG